MIKSKKKIQWLNYKLWKLHILKYRKLAKIDNEWTTNVRVWKVFKNWRDRKYRNWEVRGPKLERRSKGSIMRTDDKKKEGKREEKLGGTAFKNLGMDT
jgi:hypothetical protein